VVITLSTLLISSPQVASPPSGSAGGNPGAVSGAGSSEVIAASEISLKRHAEVVAAYTK
jgi:hypothetical protein